jgi:Family of unknown function (DUF6940)
VNCTVEVESPAPGVRRYRLLRDACALTYREVATGWQEDEGFRGFFGDLLAKAPYTAFRWETPPVTAATFGREFEFVLLDSPWLEVAPDAHSFENQFVAAGDKPIVGFPNLGGDAFLVAPCPRAPLGAYGHLAAFVRSAPDEQNHALWRMVGALLRQRLGDRRLWLSTAGGGVAWLHVRLDTRPKYYGFRAYAAAD